MTKQTTIIIFVAFITFAFGFLLGTTSQRAGQYGFLKTGRPDSFEAGWQAAKQRLEEAGFASPMTEEITSISGEVKEIKDSKIILKIQPLEPLADPELDIRIVEIDNKTKVYQLTAKDPDQYQKELADFQAKSAQQEENPGASLEPMIPPERYVKREVSWLDIKQGQEIDVDAREDIKEAKRFKAVEITIALNFGTGQLP